MSANLSEGWRQLGCSVTEFFYGSHMGKSWTNDGSRHNQSVNAKLLATARQLKAQGRLDLIFAVIYDDVLTVETAQKLRALDVPMVNYHVDLIGQWYRVLKIGKYFDRVACAQKQFWSGLRRGGIRPYYLPMAANPPAIASGHSPIAFEGVLYLGSPWSYRRQVLSNLARQNISLAIYGHNWLRETADPANAQPWRKNLHDLRYYLLPRLQAENWQRFVDILQARLSPSKPPAIVSGQIPREYIKGSYAESDFIPLLQGAAINLGFTHFQGQPGTNSEKRQVRLREFEIPMAGGFYLTQDCEELHALYKVGEQIAVWQDESDLIDKIRYYLNHPAEREKIARAGQTHCLAHHTWANRFRSLLQDLNLSLPNTTVAKIS